MKIGIFGGTFNPVHQGHLAIAEEVRSAVHLEKILFIPAGDPPHKNNREVIPAHHRLEMVRLAIKDDPHFEISELEIQRPGKSYTVETLAALKAAYPSGTEWFLILGLDAFLDFPAWREPDRLLTLCHFIVVSRPGFRFRELLRLPFLQSTDPVPLTRLDEQKEDRYRLSLGPSTQLILLRVGSWEISATEIRSHLSGGKRRRNLLPPSVESYIMFHHLYAYSK
jgi:nicotinate-nucleotide adenylyltransferase